ncbi:tRNA (adenosine(37)-N6)-threonylcarbamoyltransferase complex transferase subunit TsaD [Corynebacterium anserum]|uniref:tRNA N6-adenosine threonylcarbamoyltransferase n=1 Tax=Corynebacterium anserum TaxID=2684406 RepID=A0A7G7YPW8_9CORY|nr:tRNA (adenosine(37)-N6)-threonylcarbamoyltransferase complex transferase subunit TsaD [Corynebacterium anserum]QNH96538.1 tRNA (adenosine(37)-N6)-threonylcarbamoyltransferase complex transferase subunit TsaD [Corynebacterium anserum]
MHILTVDSSTSYVVSGIVEIPEGRPQELVTRAQRCVDNPRGHMELLTPNIVECLAEAGLEPADLSAVIVGTGPGPFTGLRVGMATAQAFADALSIPVHGVESLAAIAVDVWDSVSVNDSMRTGELLILTDARRREWFGARYELSAPLLSTNATLRTLAGPFVSKPDDILEQQPGSSSIVVAKALAQHELLVDKAHRMLSLDGRPTPRSLVLAALLKAGGVSNASVRGLLTPSEPLRALYLRRPDAVEPKAQRVSSALDFTALARGIEGMVDTQGTTAGEGTTGSETVVRAEKMAGLEGTTGAEGVADVDKIQKTEGVQSAEGENIRTVELGQADAVAMESIERDLFAQDSPWSLDLIRSELSAMNTRYFGVKCGEELIGYLGLAKVGPDVDPEWEIHTVAIDRNYQGVGLSHLLMVAAMRAVDKVGGKVFLEVRTDNAAAVGLYRRYGFEPISVRKNYYQPSGADALVMMRPSYGYDEEAENSAGCVDDSLNAPTQPCDTNRDKNTMVILGVESSCDETGVGVVEMTRGETGEVSMRMISNRVASSMQEHARFGGVVPEIASRAHLEAMGPTMRQALRDLRADKVSRGVATVSNEKPDAVAATVGPGLAGALLVGAAAAKAYAAAWQVPFYGMNHLGGHVAVDLLDEAGEGLGGTTAQGEGLNNAIALLVSGGHTQILHIRGVGKPMEELGSTLDDAAGEAYDKVARLLGLGYPGGPVIDKLAMRGNAKAVAFPRAMMRQQDSRYDFSFSGVKTAVARYVEQAEREGKSIPVEDVCASFQEAVCDVLTAKAVRAAKDVGAGTMLLGGGVSANSRLRELLAQRCRSAGIVLHIPQFSLCTDNGVMIAALAAQVIAAGAHPSGLDTDTDPSLEVEIPVIQ